MIGITIDTHTTKAIANEVAAGGSAGLPPRPRDLSLVAVVPGEVTPLFNVPGLTSEESSAMLSVWAWALWRHSRAGWRRRLAGGAEVRCRLGLAAHGDEWRRFHAGCGNPGNPRWRIRDRKVAGCAKGCRKVAGCRFNSFDSHCNHNCESNELVLLP